MTEQTQRLTLVVGATGKTGSRVVQRLRERGEAVREGSRSGTPPMDWEDRATWGPALEGATAAYVTYFPDLAADGAAEAAGAFARQAAAAGVERLVLLSGRGEPEAQRAEAAVAEAGVDWTVVRCSWFSQNFSESFLGDAVRDGVVALPVDGVGEPFVDLEDVADVVVEALTGDGHAGRVYELTGPRLVSFPEAVQEIAQASSREISYVRVGLDEWCAAVEASGEDPEVVGLLRYLFGEVLDGRNEAITDGVERVLGRPATDFATYARRAAASGAWSA